MFKSDVYIQRRQQLRQIMFQNQQNGLLLLPGNSEASYNYPANTYTFRQDSNFSYYFGLENPDFVGVIDIDNDTDYLFGNDFEIDDIIWMGPQPKVSDLGLKVGIKNTASISEMYAFFKKNETRKIHFAPTYRAETLLQIAGIIQKTTEFAKANSSIYLINSIIEMRSIKSELEIAELEKAVDIAWKMFTTGMKMAFPGRKEQEIVGAMEGISIANGRPVSFPIILSMNGHILHNHRHENILENSRLLVMDAGAETPSNYCSDITRTVPVGGKFSNQQREIYEIVLNANLNAISATKPGVLYRDCHYVAAETITTGLKELGLMKGDVKQAVADGAHALFFPHGLGHMLGMDVHDMEGLGQINVGYDSQIRPSSQFGTAYLRMARKLQPGFVVTNEPGIYFIPELIDLWKAEKKFTQYLNYDLIDKYRNFGGIRIEDDILVTQQAHQILGKPIPKTVAEIEETMLGNIT